ncbi:MAG: bifunctional hydroxymethylpyrimidine kinase/phosphomethylpyrimidine kinase [Bryobacterales bacterium]|nr:bifunctional hydroxymethylpyrimidine kinase/phosphomethylpyrimidine kinase [Bryobacterales bacterium]
MVPVALTIAGSDPSGGAGIQADLKTFHRFSVYGEAVITLVTVQNTRRVSRVEIVDPQLVAEQMDAVLEDIPPHAAKTGALGNSAVIEAVAGRAAAFRFPLVVDPVMISKHGAPLIAPEAASALKELLLPRCALITPNVPEAEALSGIMVDSIDSARAAGEAILALGARAVLIKGGHMQGGEAVDLLVTPTGSRIYTAPRIDTRHTHGTGCTYSAAITAELAKGTELFDAVGHAKQFLTRAIESNPGLGAGCGPVNHFAI